MRPARHLGAIRKLPSGRRQARYRGPDGLLRPAPETFERTGDALPVEPGDHRADTD